jgi:hypothetical protein
MGADTAETNRRRPASGLYRPLMFRTAASTAVLVVFGAAMPKAASRRRAAGVETKTGSCTVAIALKRCGDAGTPDAYSQPVSACEVGAAAPPQSAAHRRAKSPTASKYDSRWQAAPMYGKSAQRRS